MHLFRTWSGRLLLGAALGVLIVLGWIRREANIAETPVAPARPEESASPDRSVGGITNQESEEPHPPAPSLRAPRATPSYSPSQRDGEKRKESPYVIFLNVPFVSQAPLRVWDLPYKEFCEEASVLTAHYWKQGRKPPPADQIDRDLKDIQAWETEHLRTWEDTTAEEVARILREKFGYVSARVIRDVAVIDINRELDAGRPVIVPAAGRELSSPYYRPPGPLYHMLVIIGYDEAAREFITNDVGTNTKGAGFRFAYDDLYGAMGDWSVERGAPDISQKVMIVVP